MMTRLTARILPLLAGLALTGCFVSETPLIEPEAAVLPAEGGLVVCLEAEDPCLTLMRQDDGYLVEAPREEEGDLHVRFAPLIQAGGRQVFIAEAGVQTEDGTFYMYGLARRMLEPDARGATLQVAGLDCEELDETALAGFEAGGGRVETDKMTECQPASLDQLKSVLLAAHREGLATDAWWQAHGEDL
ncbi:hypothetical protein [Henriciella aquimarina]|uniref:hypothetical protein n=1 Tax=Henriciella aquimarina TaxID=545261 RepID=UPI00117A5B41|nr:hypothetical protein [Henriciella aquimarina]